MCEFSTPCQIFFRTNFPKTSKIQISQNCNCLLLLLLHLLPRRLPTYVTSKGRIKDEITSDCLFQHWTGSPILLWVLYVLLVVLVVGCCDHLQLLYFLWIFCNYYCLLWMMMFQFGPSGCFFPLPHFVTGILYFACGCWTMCCCLCLCLCCETVLHIVVATFGYRCFVICLQLWLPVTYCCWVLGICNRDVATRLLPNYD